MVKKSGLAADYYVHITAEFAFYAFCSYVFHTFFTEYVVHQKKMSFIKELLCFFGRYSIIELDYADAILFFNKSNRYFYRQFWEKVFRKLFGKWK